jgi:cytochrome c-type biogenesis protein CcmH/NrfG
MAKNKNLTQKKRKKQQRMVLWVLTILLSFGLIGSSVVWISGKFFPKPESESEEVYSPAKALAEAEAKVKSKPDDAQALANLAQVYFQAGKLPEASKMYAQAVKIEPKNSVYCTQLSLIYLLLGQYEQACMILEKELANHPLNKEARYYYAQALALGKKDYPRAIKEMEKYIDLAKTGDDVAKALQMVAEWKKILPKN